MLTKLVYHGLGSNKLEGGALRTGEAENSGMIFFTDQKDMASAYAKHGIIIEAYLSIQNPYIKDFRGEASYEFEDEYEEALAGHHDGMIFLSLIDYHDDRPSTQYVVFSPKQIIVKGVSHETE